MATLQLRNKVYYIVFSKRHDGKLIQKKFSLKTTDEKKAKRKKRDYEELYEIGRIDPFNGWTPKQEKTKKKAIRLASIVTLKELAEKFIQERTQANEISKGNYRRHLNMLRDQLGDTLPVNMITERDIRNFCFKPGLEIATQRSYLRHLNVFFNWLHDNKYVTKNIALNIKAPKVVDKVAEKIISENDLQLIYCAYRSDILEKKKNKEIATTRQNRVWFRPLTMTAYYAGLRRKEVVNLRWENINFDEETLTISETKSGKERTVPLKNKLLNVLIAWNRLNKKATSGLVFPSRKNHITNLKMSVNNITRVFKYYSKEAKLADTISFHSLRHSCATNLLKIGFDINEVAKILGHSSLDVTRIYEHLTSGDLVEKMNRLENKENAGETEKRELLARIKKLEMENDKLKRES